jgi:hypothetical protein
MADMPDAAATRKRQIAPDRISANHLNTKGLRPAAWAVGIVRQAKIPARNQGSGFDLRDLTSRALVGERQIQSGTSKYF